MKKFLTTLALSLVALSAIAEVVTEPQARMIASRFFGGNGMAAASELTLVHKGVQKSAVAPSAITEQTTYYVYNKADKGFVIIAADNTVDPVLGYSLENSFDPDNMSDGLVYWLDECLSAEIAYYRATNAAPVFSTDVRPTAGALIVAHQTAQWNQGSPYNGESPVIDGHKTITGCVATAAAIKARFHKWPYKGSGKSPAYSYDCEEAGHSVTIPANQLGRVYDYENMPLTYSGSATTAQKAAVAALMYDMGHVAQMMFGWEGSGAYTSTLCNGMKTYMHYSKNAKYSYRGSNLNTWYADLLKELQEVGPIVYDGHSSRSGGHCFIFDGMTDDNYVRVNWGWGGSNNGIFKITDSDFDFVNGQGAILNCIPDHSGIYTPDEIADATTVTYSKTLGKFSFAVKSDATFNIIYTFKTADGKVLSTKQMKAGDKVEFPLNTLSGTYYLDGYVPDYPDTVYSCEIEF